MPKVYIVKKSRKDYPKFGIKKGDSYYYWKFSFGPLVKSKTYPKPRQLTRSSFLINAYDIQDMIADLSKITRHADLEDQVQDVISSIEFLRDETQESLNNMPEHLQDTSDSGILLTERIEALENWQSEIEGVDIEIDADSIKETVIDNNVINSNIDLLDNLSFTEQSKKDSKEIENLVNEEIQEKLSEILDELQAMTGEF